MLPPPVFVFVATQFVNDVCDICKIDVNEDIDRYIPPPVNNINKKLKLNNVVFIYQCSHYIH
jgi:hypothetical protein